MRGKVYMICIKMAFALGFVSAALFEIKNSVGVETYCHSVEDRFQIILGTSITQCVNECGARRHCQALNFWSRMNLCELFLTSNDGQQRTGNCINLERDDLSLTEIPCQSKCDYGKVCEKSDSGGEECKVKECINVPVLENGVVLGNRRDVGAVIRYSCDYGYEIIGNPTSKCLDTGNWSSEAICKVAGFFEPADFVSDWHEMDAKIPSKTLVSVEHGLGETPLLVDVQVKVDSGHIFPAAGCPTRDDDEPEGYGGIAYIYNDEYVKFSSPKKNNNYLGRCVYTGITPFWEGPFKRDNYTAQVRVRAWKKSSLPAPSYSETGIPITGGKRAGSYVEKSHGIGDYPTLVISRTKFPSTTKTYSNYYSDSVGAAFSMYDANKVRSSAYVVYGYNNSTIRAWASSDVDEGIFDGTDGWNFVKVTSGELEFYAWDDALLSRKETGSLSLGQSVPGSNLQQSFSSDIDNTFTRAWVQASDGNNSGFRFIGSGSLAYDEKKWLRVAPMVVFSMLMVKVLYTTGSRVPEMEDQMVH